MSASGGVASSYRPDIDALRALAVTLVVLYHLEVPGFQGGFVGVDVFFVISGYLMTRNLYEKAHAGELSLVSFYQRRLKRLFPALAVTLLLTLALGALVMAPSHLVDLAKSALSATLSASNLLFWRRTSYFDDALKLNPLLHTWSLSLEEQFYLVYPLLMIGLARLKPTRVTPALALLTGLGFAASLWWSFKASSFAFYMMPARLWAFTLGGLAWRAEPWLGAHLRSERGGLISLGLGSLGFGLIAWSSWALQEHDVFPGYLALLPCSGAALLILAAPRSRGLSAFYHNRLTVKLGVMSYALYLVHWPLIALTRHLYFDVALSASQQLALGALTLACGALLHVGVERPLRYRERLTPRLSVLRALTLAATLILSLSALVWWTEGVPSRAAVTPQGLPQGVSGGRRFKVSYYGGAGCKAPRCVVGSEVKALAKSDTPPRAFVIGDSFPLALYRGVRAALKSEGVVFWKRSACELYSLHYAGLNNPNPARCLTTKREALSELSAHPDRPVLIGQHWRANFFEGVVLHEPSLPSPAPSASRPAQLRFDSVEAYAEFVAGELRALKATTGVRRLTVLGGPPTFGAVLSPVDCLLNPLRRDVCAARPLSPLTRWHLDFERALRRESQGAFEVLSLYPALCHQAGDERSDLCRALSPSGEPLYSDFGHLSIWGSREVAWALRAPLSHALDLEARPALLPLVLPER